MRAIPIKTVGRDNLGQVVDLGRGTALGLVSRGEGCHYMYVVFPITLDVRKRLIGLIYLPLFSINWFGELKQIIAQNKYESSVEPAHFCEFISFFFKEKKGEGGKKQKRRRRGEVKKKREEEEKKRKKKKKKQ